MRGHKRMDRISKTHNKKGKPSEKGDSILQSREEFRERMNTYRLKIIKKKRIKEPQSMKF